MNLLHTIGLMTRKEHEAVEQDRDDWRDKSMEQSVEISELTAKFKRAATDLAAQAEEIKTLKIRLHYAEPRAKKWDDSLKRSRDRKEAKKRVAKPLVAAEPPNRAADRKRMAGERGKA